MLFLRGTYQNALAQKTVQRHSPVLILAACRYRQEANLSVVEIEHPSEHLR